MYTLMTSIRCIQIGIHIDHNLLFQKEYEAPSELHTTIFSGMWLMMMIESCSTNHFRENYTM